MKWEWLAVPNYDDARRAIEKVGELDRSSGIDTNLRNDFDRLEYFWQITSSSGIKGPVHSNGAHGLVLDTDVLARVQCCWACIAQNDQTAMLKTLRRPVGRMARRNDMNWPYSLLD